MYVTLSLFGFLGVTYGCASGLVLREPHRFLGSGSIGDDDLWNHFIWGYSRTQLRPSRALGKLLGPPANIIAY